MEPNVVDSTASTTSLPAHGLNEEQLAKVEPLSELIETQLLHCVDDIRQGRWTTDPRLKTRAELNLRDLVLRLGTLLKVQPLTDEQRKLRTELLTRRTRCFVRVFSTGPKKYFQGAIPDVDWNKELIPKELYPEEDLIAAREERDFAQEEEMMKEDLRKAKERMEERTKGDRGKQRRENEARAKAVQELMAKKLQQKKRKEAANEQKRKREEEDEDEEDEQEEEEERKSDEEEERTRKEGDGKKKRKEEVKRQKRKREEEEDEQEEEEEMKRKEDEERARKEGEEKDARKRKDEEEQEEKTRKEREEKQRKRKEEEERKKEKDGRKKTAVVGPSQAPPTKKRSRREIKSKETIEDSDEVGQTDGPSTVPAAKKQKKQKTIPGPVDSDEPDPCERCHRLEFECIPNGPGMACDTCRVAKKTCSMAERGQSGGLRPTKPQARQKTTAAPVQAPPPPGINPPAAPLSRQMAQAKRRRGVDDAGKAGPSKIRKVRILVPLPKETISVKEEEANPVLPTVRVLRAPESKKVTPSVGEEKLVGQGGDSDVTSIILRRLEDQDKRIRELEASESVMAKSMVKKTYVDDVVADAIHTMEQQTQDLDFEHRETRKKLDALADNGVTFLTQQFQDLQTKFQTVDRLDKKIGRMAKGFDQEDKRRDEEDRRRDEDSKHRDAALQAMENRWSDEVIRVETNLEEEMKEQFQERDRKLVEWQSKTVSDLNSQVEESLKRLQSELQQDWWTAELDRRAKLQTEEMKALLNERPTLQEIETSFTTLGTTSKLIGQLGDLHAKTSKDNHLLQSELHTLERLYLRQLDSSAPLVNAPQQLQEMLHRQVLHSPPFHPPPAPIFQTNNVPPPQPQAPIERAMSGPPTFPSGSRLHPEPPKETLRADVTMDDESGNKGLDEVKRDDGDDDSMGLGLGIVSHVSSMSPSHDPQSPSPIRTRSRTLAMQRAASAAPLSPLHSARHSPLYAARLPPLQEETLGSSPLTTLSDLSPAKSTSGNTDRVMSEYINFDMTS